MAGPAAAEHGALRPSTWACCIRPPVPAARGYMGLLLPSTSARFARVHGDAVAVLQPYNRVAANNVGLKDVKHHSDLKQVVP